MFACTHIIILYLCKYMSCMYVCTCVFISLWCSGLVIARLWVQVPNMPQLIWFSYPLSPTTMWCEKSIQHHPTSPTSCKWRPGIFGGANYLAIFHIPALVQVGLRVPTPLSGRDSQSSSELLALLQEFACLMHRRPGSARWAWPLIGSNIICICICVFITTCVYS